MADLPSLLLRRCLTHETDGGGKDARALLPRLDRACRVRASVAYTLNMVENGYLRVAREEEVAVA